MGEIFLTSDTHFCHDKGFLFEPRGFSNVYDMNDAIIENWNKVVGPQDDVYLLGDVMLNDNEQGIKCLKALKGNIHIALGNHDSDARIALYSECWNVVEIEMAYRLKVGHWRFYASHYPTLCANFDDGKGPSQRLYSVCGHTHTKDVWNDWNKSPIIHCEMDTNHCTPWNIEEVIDNIRWKANV